MVQVISKFALLNLPLDAHRNVLRTMIPKDLIKYSLCSKCSKDRVRTLGIRLFKLKSIITSPINIFLSFTEGLEVPISFNLSRNRGQRESSYPESVCLNFMNNRDAETIQNRNHQLTIRQWIQHLMDVFHRQKFDFICFQVHFFTFDIEVLVNAFKGIQCDTLASLIKIGNFSRLARTIFPQLENYQLTYIEESDFKEKHGFFMQHGNNVRVTFAQNPLDVITLNDLLILNAKYFRQDSAEISDKELNRFLKLWRGGSNPRLVCMILQFDRTIYRDEILRGMNTQMMGPNDVKQFTHADGTEIRVTNAIVIFRNDGTEATLSIFTQSNISNFAFIVWM